jgi:hybrid cluster-associated redox disulfide protein
MNTNKNDEQKINKKMLIGDAIKISPIVAATMFEYGLHCVGCSISKMETIEEGCLAHGLSDQQIEEMVKKINKKIK